MKFKNVKEFDKEYKKLTKKHKGLEKDFGRFVKVLMADCTSLTGLKKFSNLGKKVKTPIYKATKFRCKAINKGSKSGFRIIFAFECKHEENLVTFIEFYNHSGKPEGYGGDKKRIKKYFEEK